MNFDIRSEMRGPLEMRIPVKSMHLIQNDSQQNRKEVNIICKGKDPMMYSTKMLISLGSSKHICIDFDEQLARKLSKAKLVSVDRSWDGELKTLEEVEGKVTVQVVDADDITPRGLSKRDKVKQMEEYKKKLEAEQAALNKQIDDLNNL